MRWLLVIAGVALLVILAGAMFRKPAAGAQKARRRDGRVLTGSGIGADVLTGPQLVDAASVPARGVGDGTPAVLIVPRTDATRGGGLTGGSSVLDSGPASSTTSVVQTIDQPPPTKPIHLAAPSVTPEPTPIIGPISTSGGVLI